jgi:hypothetical protein
MNNLINKQLDVLGGQKNNANKISQNRHFRESIRPLYRGLRKSYYGLLNEEVKLPNFLIVGGQKCGTSSLHHYLANHPSVWSPEKKELHFFDYYYDYGVPFYKRFFRKQPDNIADLLVGEATPEYIFHPYSAERISEVLPEVKAIVLLRNPIERAFSAWGMGVRQGWESLNFEDAIAAEGERIRGDLYKMSTDKNFYGYEWNHHSYLLRGHYSHQIENWLLHFKRENLLVLSAERFFSNTKEEFKKVCEFLELDEWYPEEFKNMFVGLNNELSIKTRKELETYFQPYNQELYALIEDDYAW